MLQKNNTFLPPRSDTDNRIQMLLYDKNSPLQQNNFERSKSLVASISLIKNSLSSSLAKLEIKPANRIHNLRNLSNTNKSASHKEFKTQLLSNLSCLIPF